MKNLILELAEKRKIQSQLAEKVGINQKIIKSMNDNEIRFYNMGEEKYPLSMEVKGDITFGNVYQFALEHYNKTQENILDKPINEKGQTLLWSGGQLEEHIKNRKMTKDQYSCFDKAVDLMKSGEFDDYWSIRQLSR